MLRFCLLLLGFLLVSGLHIGRHQWEDFGGGEDKKVNINVWTTVKSIGGGLV